MELFTGGLTSVGERVSGQTWAHEHQGRPATASQPDTGRVARRARETVNAWGVDSRPRAISAARGEAGTGNDARSLPARAGVLGLGSHSSRFQERYGLRRIAGLVGLDRRTVSRYLTLVTAARFRPESSEITEELVLAVLVGLQPGRPSGGQHGQSWVELEPQRDFLKERLEEGLGLTKSREEAWTGSGKWRSSDPGKGGPPLGGGRSGTLRPWRIQLSRCRSPQR